MNLQNRKRNNIIIIVIICLFIAVAISGLFIIDAVLSSSVNGETETETTTEHTVEEELETETGQETETEISESFPETIIETTPQQTVPIETTPIETTPEVDWISIGNEILQNLKPVDYTITKTMGTDSYSFKTYIQNDTNYTITGITLSYQVSASDFTYLIYQGSLAPGQRTEELTCSAASGSETYPLYSQEISFLDENGMEHILTYDATTKTLECY